MVYTATGTLAEQVMSWPSRNAHVITTQREHSKKTLQTTFGRQHYSCIDSKQTSSEVPKGLGTRHQARDETQVCSPSLPIPPVISPFSRFLQTFRAQLFEASSLHYLDV